MVFRHSNFCTRKSTFHAIQSLKLAINDPFRECLHWNNQVQSEAETTVNQEFFKSSLQNFTSCPKLQVSRLYPKKSGAWVSSKYWHTIGGDNWVFSVTKDGKIAETLINHASKPIVRHIKINGNASPFDGNLKYWSSRRGEHPLVPKRVAKLLKEQKGKCLYCGLYFREDDLIEVDHIIPKSQGKKDRYGNLQALHRHCHDSKTAQDNRYSKLWGSTPAEEELLG